MLTPDSIVPDPTNPQSFNRYTYVFNNPLKYIDPSGHFTEEAIQDYIWSTCGDSWTCFDTTLANWQSNTEWWALIRTAQAGDVMFMSSTAGEFASAFTGEGQDSLTGLKLSDPYGNDLPDNYDLNGMPSNFGINTILDKGFRSSKHGGWVHLAISNGFIRWTPDKQRIAGVYPENVRQTVPRGQWVRDGISSAFSFGLGALGGLVPVGEAGSWVVKYLPNALVGGTGSFASTYVSNWWISDQGLRENDVTIHLSPLNVTVNRGPDRDEIRNFGHQ